MKLRSAQFALLVLLFTSLSVAEASACPLAGEWAAISAGLRISPGMVASGSQRANEALGGDAGTLRPRLLPEAQRSALQRVWPMRQAARQAAAVQASSAFAVPSRA